VSVRGLATGGEARMNKQNILLHANPGGWRARDLRTWCSFLVNVSTILGSRFIVTRGCSCSIPCIHHLPNAPNIVLPTLFWALSSLVVGVVTAALVTISAAPVPAPDDGLQPLRRVIMPCGCNLPPAVNWKCRKLQRAGNGAAEYRVAAHRFLNNFSHEFKTPSSPFWALPGC
jgi:hypothetical protein